MINIQNDDKCFHGSGHGRYILLFDKNENTDHDFDTGEVIISHKINIRIRYKRYTKELFNDDLICCHFYDYEVYLFPEQEWRDLLFNKKINKLCENLKS